MAKEVRHCLETECSFLIFKDSKGHCMYCGCTITLGSKCGYDFEKENISISQYNFPSNKKEEILTMPDGPWNWRETDKDIYLDGPGENSLPNPNLMEPEK